MHFHASDFSLSVAMVPAKIWRVSRVVVDATDQHAMERYPLAVLYQPVAQENALISRPTPIIVENALQTVPEFNRLVASEHALIYTLILITVAPVLRFRVLESLQHVVRGHVLISAQTPVIAVTAVPLAQQPPQLAALETAQILPQILIIAVAALLFHALARCPHVATVVALI
ncbi:hypothetical protein N7494_000736 [Penicillium frequentans]|uniref:Uncharacterized protein n=1 Tax=Penicillium frequentans TaxID=3151616 RepID=A0AAD6D6M5_9EURO|nr:hypothetical protein N7494_000736 [Penicillium glabrum]